MKGLKSLVALFTALTISTATLFAFGCVNNDGKKDIIGNINGIFSSAGNNKTNGENIEVIPTEYELDKLIADTKFEMESPVYLRSTSGGIGWGFDLVKTAYIDLTELKTGARIFEKSFIDEQAKNATVKAINSASGKIFDASDLNGLEEGLADTFNINVSSEVKKAMRLTNARKIYNNLYGNSYVNNYYFVLKKSLNGYSLSLPDLSEDLSVYKANLSPYFVENIGRVVNGTITYEQFFKMYGTHVIMEGIFGGKLTVCYGASSDSCDVGGKFRPVITSELKRIISNGADKDAFIPDIAQSTLNCTVKDVSEGMYCTVNGGDPFPMVGIGEFMNVYEEWLPSLVDDNVLISFTENGAVPIWKLLPEEYESYSADFEQALNDYVVNYTISLLNA